MTDEADAMEGGVVLSHLEELSLDDAVFGVHGPERVLLDKETEVFAEPRFDLQLLAAALSRPSNASLEAIPETLRARVQAEAFAHFEVQGAAPKATATTTGANVVELSDAKPRRTRRSRGGLSLAFAACLACLTLVAIRTATPSTRAVATRPTLTHFNPASELTATAGPHAGAVRWAAEGELELVVTSDQLQRDPAQLKDVRVWILRDSPSGTTAWTRGPALQVAGDVLSCSLGGDAWRIRGWALTMRSEQDGPGDAFLAAGPRE